MIKIMKAKSKDVESVKSLNQKLFHNDFHFDDTLDVTWPTRNKKYYTDRIKEKNSLVLIAKNKSDIVGYLIGTIMKNHDNWRKINNLAELENMLVLEAYRGQGIGSKMINKFVKWAKSNKVKRARVVASAANNVAINAYKKNGFDSDNNVMEMNI